MNEYWIFFLTLFLHKQHNSNTNMSCIFYVFSSLHTQMNLQLCFINNSESEDEEEQEVGNKELKNSQV